MSLAKKQDRSVEQEGGGESRKQKGQERGGHESCVRLSVTLAEACSVNSNGSDKINK